MLLVACSEFLDIRNHSTVRWVGSIVRHYLETMKPTVMLVGPSENAADYWAYRIATDRGQRCIKFYADGSVIDMPSKGLITVRDNWPGQFVDEALAQAAKKAAQKGWVVEALLLDSRTNLTSRVITDCLSKGKIPGNTFVYGDEDSAKQLESMGIAL